VVSSAANVSADAGGGGGGGGGAAALPPWLYVETPVLDAPAGTLLTILNWRNTSGRPFPLSVAVSFEAGSVVSALHGQLPFSQAASGERVSFVLPTLPNISDFVSIHKKAVGQGPPAMD
jgi:hypothetical protein